MFGGGDQVDNTATLCPNCKGQVFWLYDLGPGPASSTKIVAMKCTKMACLTQQNKVLLKPMAEGHKEYVEVKPLPGQKPPPENMQICSVAVAVTPQAPDGGCLGSKFRVFNRGNEYIAICQSCGDHDTIGNEFHDPENK